MDFPQARQRFYEEINQPDEQIDLATAALYLAQEEYPGLDVQRYLTALERMAAEVVARLPIRALSAAHDSNLEPVPIRRSRIFWQHRGLLRSS